MLARSEVHSYHQYSFAGSITLVWQLASVSALDSLNCAVSSASSGRGEGRTIKNAPLAQKRWNRWTTSPAGRCSTKTRCRVHRACCQPSGSNPHERVVADTFLEADRPYGSIPMRSLRRHDCAVCSRGNAQSSVQRHVRAGIESAPSLLLRSDRASRTSASNREERDQRSQTLWHTT